MKRDTLWGCLDDKDIAIKLTAEDIRDMKTLVKELESTPQMGGVPYRANWYELIEDFSDDTEVKMTESVLAEALVLAMDRDSARGNLYHTLKPWYKKFSPLFDWKVYI